MKTFKSSREIPVRPEQIFSAFTNPDRLAKWWGPSGFTNTFNRIEFKSGGKWSFVMHGPDGTNYPNESEFVEIVLNRKVVIRHLSQPNFTLSILISETAKGTLVEWNQEFDNDELADKIAPIVIPSNEQNLDRLSEEVSEKL